MNESKSALSMTDKEYAVSKARMTDWRQKPTKAAAQFDRKKLDDEIKAFEQSGLKSAFSQNTSSTSAPPPPAKTVTGSPSALDLTDAQYRQMKRQIDSGRVPDFNASDAIHA
jgi:hypothetical protein